MFLVYFEPWLLLYFFDVASSKNQDLELFFLVLLWPYPLMAIIRQNHVVGRKALLIVNYTMLKLVFTDATQHFVHGTGTAAELRLI